MSSKEKNLVETAGPEERATQPVREFPAEAYCFELEDLLAQLPKSEAPDLNAGVETTVAEGYATQPVREFPEEAYFFEFEDPGDTLAVLLAQITEDNRHEEMDFGPPVGKEVW